ncbi:RNA-binding protein 34 [Harmonia axyridis]|uniref:RNA-binding protein 34 n=1 Tax=Harmonia axyridis TaxID=115357 RepID=UPI001E275033|nr:RNA-binding protein 34 [Harmonia axyridis]
MEVVFEKGSLSELITGKKIENKEKVVIRYETIPSKQNISSGTTKKDEKIEDGVISKPKSKKLKKKKLLIENENERDIETDTINKKMKLLVKNENERDVETDIINNEGSMKEIVENKETTPKEKISISSLKEKKEKVKKFKELKVKKEELNNNPEEWTRTIFVGNVPLTATKIKFKKFFNKYGKVESVRFRCPPVKNINSSKKVTVIKGEYHPERSSWISYVKFQTEEDAKKALEANGEIYKDHHLRVSICKSDEKHDESKAIFIGNLTPNTEDDQLWQTFQSCGNIESVRIVRDSNTGMGKGFAYINFTSSDSVQLALEMEDVKINKRVIRIQPCNTKAAKKNKLKNVVKAIKPKKPRNTVDKNNFKRKREDNENTEVEIKKRKTSHTPETDQSFAGTKVQTKKKKKKNKGALKKLRIAQKLIS